MPHFSPPQRRTLGCVDYTETLDAMRQFTAARGADTPDEIWLLSHPPVFTQGQAGKPEHLLLQSEIPLVQSDRGGQITYHGPGQVVVYTLIDLARRRLGVRHWVSRLEQAAIDLLAQYAVAAWGKREAPGVYVYRADGQEAKIASLGLRVRHGRCYHGLAFNTCMDLTPFQQINPCGYRGLVITQLADLLGDLCNCPSPETVGARLAGLLEKTLEESLEEPLSAH